MHVIVAVSVSACACACVTTCVGWGVCQLVCRRAILGAGVLRPTTQQYHYTGITTIASLVQSTLLLLLQVVASNEVSSAMRDRDPAGTSTLNPHS